MSPTPKELKKALINAGFEIYRTKGDEIAIANRVRDNLIMDSGVRLRAGSPLGVKMIVGIRRAEFPDEDDAALFSRVRDVARPALLQGFREMSSGTTPVLDPTDPSRTLDTFYEVTFEKTEEHLEEALSAVRIAIAVAKLAEPRA